MGAQALALKLHDPELAFVRHAIFGGSHAAPCQHIAGGGLTGKHVLAPTRRCDPRPPDTVDQASAVKPTCLTMGAHLARSSLISAASSAGEDDIASRPNTARLSTTSGLARA